MHFPMEGVLAYNMAAGPFILLLVGIVAVTFTRFYVEKPWVDLIIFSLMTGVMYALVEALGAQAPITDISRFSMGVINFGIIMVFLTLSAQYESYIDPIIILLTVPLALLGALGFVALRGMNNDVYVQVALVMLIGLSSKNAILIVEFANQSREMGLTIVQSAQRAAEERFRPILMTAISSLVGFFPLVIATGAGSASRWAIGTALFGGLLVATVLSFLVVPVLYVVIKSLEAHFLGTKTPPSNPDNGSSDSGLVTNTDCNLTLPSPNDTRTSTETESPAPTQFQEGDSPA